MKYLIMTLGTGQGVENGLAKSIKAVNPDRVIFLVTGQSAATIDRISAIVPEMTGRFEPPEPLADSDDVEKCAEDAKRVILRAMDRGASASEIDADFTSGTKAMTAGLAVAATALGVERLVYVSGERERGGGGRVLTGTERVISVYPTQFVIDQRRRELRTLFNRRLFETGLLGSKRFWRRV